ncbi:MAG: polysaccharide deacetylase family protein [Tsuneonella sp.]
MTAIYLTIDTEYSAAFARAPQPVSREENFRRAIAGRVSDGEGGIFYQMDVLERHGCRGVFFVDPLPALVWGPQAIADVVGPIVARGHDVQLHCHTEWLEIAGPANPLGSRSGDNMADFTLAEQISILEIARDALVAAGAPPRVAFRAGNYGANDDTLRALARVGITYDTSFAPGIARSACRIALDRAHRRPLRRLGVIEVPIGCIEAGDGSLRHAQVTALSVAEMRSAILHARDTGVASFTLVSHSFELLCRNRQRINTIVRRRFERLCEAIETVPGVRTATYRAEPPRPSRRTRPAPLLPHSTVRAALRVAEQALSNALYGGA